MAQVGRKFLRLQASRLGPATLFFVAALICNLYRLAVPSIWFDEAFSVELARQPLPLLWHIIFGLEPNMELYYLLLHGWLVVTACVGVLPTEFVVRLPSAIFAALSTAIVFLFGRRFFSRTVGMVAASLYLLNDLQLVYAQQARSYSLQMLLVCIAWYAFCSAFLSEDSHWRWWICFVVATTLAIYTQLFSIFLLVAQMCTFGIWCVWPTKWSKGVRRQWRAGLMSLVCIGLLNVPLLPVSLISLHSSNTAWLPVPELRDVGELLVAIGGDNKAYMIVLVVGCGVALYGMWSAMWWKGRFTATVVDRLVEQRADKSAVGAINRLLRERRGLFSEQAGRNKLKPLHEQAMGTCHITFDGVQVGQVPIGMALVCWLCVPLGISFVVSQGAIHLFAARYLVTVVPALLLLAVVGIGALRWRLMRCVLTLGLLVLALQAVPLYYRSAQVEDWNSATFWLEQHYQAGDGLVCYDNAVEQGCQVSVQYYLDAYPSAAHFTADTPGAFSWTTFRSVQPEAAVDPTVLAAFGREHTRIFFIVGRLPDTKAAMLARRAQGWLNDHFQYETQIVTRTVTVRLYKTTP